MAKDHSHKSAVEPTGGSTLEVVDVDRKPSYPVAALEPKHVEPHSFDSMTQVVTYLRDKLRDTPLVSPEESAAVTRSSSCCSSGRRIRRASSRRSPST